MKIIKRDINIQKSYTREINLKTKVFKSNKKYSRKRKHKVAPKGD